MKYYSYLNCSILLGFSQNITQQKNKKEEYIADTSHRVFKLTIHRLTKLFSFGLAFVLVFNTALNSKKNE